MQTWRGALQRWRNYILNGQNNTGNDPPIFRVPREVIDTICSYLRVDDLVSFRLSCRKFYRGDPPFSDLGMSLRSNAILVRPS